MNGDNIFHRGHIVWNWVWLGLLGILVGIFLTGMPKYWDDYMFMYHLRFWFDSQGVLVPENGGNIFTAGFPYKEIVETWHDRFLTDNSRIGNMLVVIFLLFPKWLGSGIMSIGFMWVVYEGFRMTGVNIRRSATIPLAVLLLGLIMPWRNHLGGMDYQFNYIGANILSFVLLLLLQKRRDGKKGILACFVTGLVTGGWQEAISLPLLWGIVAMAVAYKDYRRNNVYAGIAGLILGIVWIFSSPGHMSRASYNAEIMMQKACLMHIIWFLRTTFMYWIMLTVWFVTVWRSGNGFRLLIKDRIMFFITVSGFVSAGIVLVTDPSPRVGWWSILVGVFGLIYVLDKYYGRYWGHYKRQNIFLSVLMLIFTYTHWVIVDYTVFKIRDSYLSALNYYVKNPDKDLFCKIIDRNNTSIWCGNMPDEGMFSFLNLTIDIYYKHLGGRPFVFIPEELRDVTENCGNLIAGNAGIRKYKGIYYMPRKDDSSISSTKEVYVDYGNRSRKLKVWTGEFTSEKDGRDYIYIFLFENWFDSHFNEVKRVDLK